jgi:hypothetical protein
VFCDDALEGAREIIRLTGCQAAFAAAGRQFARPKAIAANFGVTDISSSH